jgi:hypothetical protein
MIKNELIQKYENRENKKIVISDYELFNYVNIPEIDYFGIMNLLDFFERKKESFKNKQLFINKSINRKYRKKRILRKNNDLINIYFSNFNRYCDYSHQNIYNTIEHSYSETRKVVIKDGELTRAQIKESMNITNEILSALKENLIENNGCAEKMWMLARHPEFTLPLQSLISNGFVEENSSHYTWKKEKNKEAGYGINILGNFIKQNADLSKWASTSKSKKDDDEKGIFTKRVWEPFNIAFKEIELENNIRNTGEPKNYDRFLKQIKENSKQNIILK